MIKHNQLRSYVQIDSFSAKDCNLASDSGMESVDIILLQANRFEVLIQIGEVDECIKGDLLKFIVGEH